MMSGVEKMIDEEVGSSFNKSEARVLALAFVMYIEMLADHESLNLTTWPEEQFEEWMGMIRKLQALVTDGREAGMLSKAFDTLADIQALDRFTRLRNDAL
jgi:hypothetical protein